MPNHDKWSHPWTVRTHASWCPKIPLKKFMKTFSWCLAVGKLKTEQKLIVLWCLQSPPHLFSRKIGAQSHSAKFLNWGDHVSSVPDLAATSPPLFKENCADLHIGDMWSSRGSKTVKNYPKISGTWNKLNALIDNIDAIQFRLSTELGWKDK